jgi:hypothetical protein
MASAKSKELEVQEETDLVEVEEISPEEAALIAQNQSEVDASEFIIPILKLGQPLTDEVTSGQASAGDFILGLTGEAFEAPLEFVVAGKGKGRFRPGRDGVRTLVAYDTPTVPWKEDPHFGKPFAEHPDAEEKFKERVDAGEIEWGSGPPIQTTFNFTGYIVGSDVPVRLSLRRTSAPAARKWTTLLDAVLRGRYWDQVFEIGSELQKNAKGTYYVLTVQPKRKTTPEEKKNAMGLATALRNQQVVTVGDEADTPMKEPEAAEGALEV